MRRLFLRLMLLVGITTSAAAKISMEKVTAAREATAMLVNGSKSTATAFCIHGHGVFATNAHAIKGLKLGENVLLVVRAGEPEAQVEIKTKILRIDHELDLAILKARDSDVAFSSIPLCTDQLLAVTDEVAAIGYPFGKDLSLQPGTYPSVSVNIGRVAAMRDDSDGPGRIQIDAAVNPGNSGGPVINSAGEVVGVVVSGVPGSGVNFAIPAAHLKRLLKEPLFDIDLPKLSVRTAMRPVDIRTSITLVTGDPAIKKPLSLELELHGKKTPMRETAAGKFLVEATLFDEARLKAIQLNARMSNGKSGHVGTLAGRTITVDKKDVELLDVVSIHPKRVPPLVVTADGTRHTGEIGNFDSAVIDSRGLLTKTNPLEMFEIKLSLSLPSTELRRIPFKLLLSDAAGVRIAEEPSFAIVGGRGQSDRGSLPEDGLARWGEPRPLKLPGEVSNTAIGGMGQFIALHLRDLRQVAVFDTNTREISAFVALQSTEAIVTAGRDHLVAIYTTKGTVSTWPFTDLDQESNRKLPKDAGIFAAEMGSGSMRNLIVQRLLPRPDSAGRALQKTIDILDLRSLRFLLDGDVQKGARWEHYAPGTPHKISFSAAQTRDIWAQSPSGIFQLKAGKVEYTPYRETGWLLLAPAGDRFYTKSGGVFSATGRLLIRGKDSHGLLPSTLGHIYLSVPLSYSRSDHPNSAAPKAYLSEDGPMMHLPQIEGFTARGRVTYPRTLGIEKRLFLIPQSDLFAYIPDSLNQIILHDYSIEAELRKLGEKYLYVTSSPPPVAKIGEAFEFNFTAVSDAPPITYKADSAPAGLTLDEDGRLTWTPPKSASGSEQTIVLRVRNAAGAEIFNVVRLLVE